MGSHDLHTTVNQAGTKAQIHRHYPLLGRSLIIIVLT